MHINIQNINIDVNIRSQSLRFLDSNLSNELQSGYAHRVRETMSGGTVRSCTHRKQELKKIRHKDHEKYLK